MAGATDTPMMRQYLDLKAQVPDALLLYRMGDFYELFLDDARVAAAALDLTLTSRNKNDPDPVPMAGVPHHALDAYLRRLLDAGHKVAIAEQRPGASAKLMERDIVRVVSPGVPMDPEGLDAREPVWLGALTRSGGAHPVYGLAFLEVSTGDLRLAERPDAAEALAELHRFDPRELILAPSVAEDAALSPGFSGRTLSAGEPRAFDAGAGRRRLHAQLGVADLAAFGASGLDPALAAAAALLAYVTDRARVPLGHLQHLAVLPRGSAAVLDEATRRNLELLRTLRGGSRNGTLLALLDRTLTGPGARLLRDWLLQPLVALAPLHARQDAVEALTDARLRRPTREALREVADIERIAGKVAQARAHARDLVGLQRSLTALAPLWGRLAAVPALAPHLVEDLLPDVADDIAATLVDDPPLALTDGGLIRPGVSAELDRLAALGRDGRQAIAAIEERERARTGIASLKVKHNRVVGYFLEVTEAQLARVPADWHLKQHMSGARRYMTAELKEYEEAVLGADDRRTALEHDLFLALRARVAAAVPRLMALARAVAFVDTVAALAEVAVERRYVRPLVDDGLTIEIEAGRHPVVEAAATDERFVPNDLALDAQRRLIVLTGPNMAGKSTVMRQLALTVLLAQIGAFVPAARARIGLCDRLFVRVGASDDLARGQSTFMVEMSETAWILRHATPRSLVLLDEIGRGTSTYDGLAIAWAVAEAVHDSARCRAIFATHYHELCALADERPGVLNQHVAVSDRGEQVRFLRTLRDGGASRSYGIQCARLAGLPEPVLARARALLVELEKRPVHPPPSRQLALFAPSTPAPAPVAPALQALADALRAIDPDTLNPRQAHDALYALRALLPADTGD